MAEYFNSIQATWRMPIITKNNRNTLILEMIHNTIPNAFFIMVNRDPADVIQSTMQASRDFFGTDKIIWGLRDNKSFSPNNYNDLLDAYCHQYVDLQDSIDKSLNSLPSEDYMLVDYEHFCDNPTDIIKELSSKLKAKYDVPDEIGKSGSSKYHISRRLYNEAASAEINRRISDIRSAQ